MRRRIGSPLAGGHGSGLGRRGLREAEIDGPRRGKAARQQQTYRAGLLGLRLGRRRRRVRLAVAAGADHRSMMSMMSMIVGPDRRMPMMTMVGVGAAMIGVADEMRTGELVDQPMQRRASAHAQHKRQQRGNRQPVLCARMTHLRFAYSKGIRHHRGSFTLNVRGRFGNPAVR
jgi:hypothetical protein